MPAQSIKDTQPSTQASPKYHIDQRWYEAQHRSFQYMIDSRIEGLEEPKAKAAAPDKAPRRRGAKAAADASPKVTTMEALSKLEGFVHPQLSILESVFRLLLVHQNKPMNAEELSQELAEHGIGVMDTRVVTPQSLTRMLDADFHYGIQRVEEPV